MEDFPSTEACIQGACSSTLTWEEAIGDDPDWRKTLIVKILGKTPAFNLLFSELRSLWNLKAEFSLVDLGNGFYLVKVENPEDYLRILTEGSWVVGGYYLTQMITMATETEQDAAAMELPHQVEKEKGPLGARMVAQRRDKMKKKQSTTMAVGETSVNNGLIFIKYRNCYLENNNTVRLLTDATYEVHSDFPIPFKSCSGWLKVLGSIRGLVCLYDYHHQVSGSKIFLYNPSIRQHKVLPVSTVTRPKSQGVQVDSVALGFGYDKMNDDYKVIRVASLRYNVKRREFYKNQADVYSLKMDSLKEVRLKDCVNLDLLEEYQASIGGAIHWLASKREGKFMNRYTLIVCFDVSTEEFRWFQLPDCVAGGVGEHGQKLIFERGNSLCVINCRWGGNNHCDIWLMKEYGVQESWTRLTSVPCPGTSNLLGFGINGELFLETGRRLAMFDLETKEQKDVGINGECFSLTPYVESQVSLNGGTYGYDDDGYSSDFDSCASSCDFDFGDSDEFFFNKNFDNNFLLTDYFKNSSSGPQWSIRLLTHDTFNVYLDVALPFEIKRLYIKRFHIVGSCNGLVCFEDYLNTGQIFLYNPNLNQHKTLPQPYEVSYRERVVIGFGYDSVINDYKVVLWYIKEDKGQKLAAQVYTLGMNCWRKVETPYHYVTPFFGSDKKSTVFLNGGILWLGYNRRHIIICFNVSSEEFQWFPLPDYVRGFDMKISVYKDLVCVVNSVKRLDEFYYDIWVMSKYGVQESWTRLHTLKIACPDYDNRFLRGILINGELLWENVINYNHRCLTVDYPDDGKSRNIDQPIGFNFFVHKESLVSLM
ncbi:hypothetical protein COLO4_11917 [Corchorus olitorius]|uniref:F-box associated domain-containing protein n=1 Tax=Corchorus olitorius TaxID=93759 RepID=A0A1R3K2T8_9ROSI|nr:hypothetical protein COLO4_11917 [Corchorus olitorius]